MRAALVLAVFTFTACTPRSSTIGTFDGGTLEADPTLTLTGSVCTAAPDPTSFRTKLILLLDQSGSMCITDPPGSQGVPGFCETYAAIPPGLTQPARVTAVKRWFDRLATRPDLDVVIVPYDTTVKGVVTGQPGTAQLYQRIDSLQSELGKGSDLQGALQYAYSTIESEVLSTESTQPELLGRTRYVVMLITDGAPFPRCSSNDGLSTYADDAHPDLVWADSVTSYCNTVMPNDPDLVSGFVAGEARNQNAQLFDLVDRMRALRSTHYVGDVIFHTTFLFNDESIADCGVACQDLWGARQRWPGPTAVPGDQTAAFAKAEGRWLFRELANHGGGTYTEIFGRTALANFSLVDVDVSSLAGKNVLKKLLVEPLRATRFEGEWRSDKDGDGVIDALEADAGTDPLVLDTDGDGFDDGFELGHRGDGFDPLVRDLRGCDPVSPATPSCTVRDTDGDGLSQYAEAYFGTSPTLQDSDRDGFPDGFEVRHGFNPGLPLNGSLDTDGDRATDAQELVRGSDPLVADLPFINDLGIRTLIAETVQPDLRVCYSFTVSNLPLKNPPQAGGFNQYKLWFGSTAENLDRDVGTWTSACGWAQKTEAVAFPANLVLDIPQSAFISPPSGVSPALWNCVGGGP